MQETGRNYTKKALNILKLQCLLENIKAADPNLGVGHTITEKLYKKNYRIGMQKEVCAIINLNTLKAHTTKHTHLRKSEA